MIDIIGKNCFETITYRHNFFSNIEEGKMKFKVFAYSLVNHWLTKKDHPNLYVDNSVGKITISPWLDYSGVRLSFYTYYVSPIEMGLVWAMIMYVKSYFMALDFWLQTNMK